jgi:hypothetical protein
MAVADACWTPVSMLAAAHVHGLKNEHNRCEEPRQCRSASQWSRMIASLVEV